MPANLKFDPYQIASRLRDFRIKRGYSIREFAKVINVHFATYSGWEKKATANTIFYLPIIEISLGLKVGEILYGKPVQYLVESIKSKIKKS